MSAFLLADSSTLINLLATEKLETILRVFPEGAGICSAVRAETLFLRSEKPDVTHAPVRLDPFLENGTLQLVPIQPGDETALYVTLAGDLDDGESMTLSIAYYRGYQVAIDDKKGRRIARERLRIERLLRTSDILHAWSLATAPADAEVKVLLGRIRDRARFEPPNDDPRRAWWKAMLAD